ncbi:MAG: methionine--tRNA ligase [Candidatus Sumerlaeia bacterium]
MSTGSDFILVGVAWPYANGEQHIGHIAGAYLPPDIFSRYQRMCGRRVLMVSGSDTHGTPVTLQADKEGVSPTAIIERYHPRFIESYLKLGLTFDLFTHTDTQNHWDVTHDLFRRHLEKGFITTRTEPHLFDPVAGRFLPDRYVEGTCPRCGYGEARGDQCDQCGATLDARELINPRSKISGATRLEVRDTEHFYLELDKLNDPLLEWISRGKDHWRPQVINFARAELEKRELRPRSITRDLNWGITIPLPGYETKRIYVWYDAVIGYLSAAREWAAITGEPERWREWWDSAENPEARTYYFIGKDNIPFHAIIWPGMLWAYGGLNLPYDVPANEYLNMFGRKFSKSRGHTIGINDVLSRYQPDAWRYALTAMAPETADVDFTWDDFVDRVNNELLANWGNLVSRVTKFAFNKLGDRVPEPGDLGETDRALLAGVQQGFETVGALYEAVRLKAALEECRRLSALVNEYINACAPWAQIKSAPTAAATTIWTALQAIEWLKTLWSPILPHTSERVHAMLGGEGTLFGRQFTETIEDARGRHLVLRYDHAGAVGRWAPERLEPGRQLGRPEDLIVKLPPDTAAREADLAATE